MDTLSNIAYYVLIALALIWTIGLRVRLEVMVHTVLGAMFFLLGAIWIGVFDADKIHALWILPAGFIFPIIMAFIAATVPPLFWPFKIAASFFSNIVRVGIPAERIREAQEAGLSESIERLASQQENKHQ